MRHIGIFCCLNNEEKASAVIGSGVGEVCLERLKSSFSEAKEVGAR